MVNVVTSASANTFGSWVALDASTATDVWISHVTVAPSESTGIDSYCVEIGTGASPAAKIRFSFTGKITAEWPCYIFALPIPIKVASGTAISARTSCADPFEALDVYIGISYYTGLG